MRRWLLKRLFGIHWLQVPDEDTLYEMHRRIEEPRVAGRISKELRRSVNRKRPGKKRSDNILIWGNQLAFTLKFEKIRGPRQPFEEHKDEKKKYRFFIDERIYYRKLISRPSLGLSPPKVQRLIRPVFPAYPHPAAAIMGWHILPVNSLIN